MERRKLPIGGVQTFSQLREDYDVYVDKTSHIYDIASRYKAVFLARPRRFGKSLLCSTIKSLFRGEKEYFEGLDISRTDWEWREHPVIHLDLSTGNYTKGGATLLCASINSQLETCAKKYGIEIPLGEFISINFKRLIMELSEKNGPAVVVIDEYDNPLLSTIMQPEINSEIREELKGFYGVLKQSDQYLRFVFVTGVTKFGQISVFSGFNQPMDISMFPGHCDICGITQEELERYFAPEIEAFSPKYGGRDEYLKRLRLYYNGYNFTREKIAVYNTYGLLNHLNSSGYADSGKKVFEIGVVFSREKRNIVEWEIRRG